MRIGVDACCWSNRRGFGRFTRELVEHMVAEFPRHRFLLVVDRQTAYECALPKGVELEIVPTRRQPSQAASARGLRGPVDLLRMSWATARHRLDAFLFPAVYSYFPLLRRIPTAILFHDAIAEHYPELVFPGGRSRMFWRLKTWLALRQADRVVTVSASARRQIAAAFALRESSIHVITEGPSRVFQPLREPARIRAALAKHRLPLERRLLLYVGGISPHKNLGGLLRALAHIAQDRSWHLVLVGDHAHDSFLGCHAEIAALGRELGLGDRMTFTGYVSNDDLAILYTAATLLVMPSFCEGFGLPVVEAMACGLPVVASCRGALPEVLGPAGVFFEPDNPEEMARALRLVLEDTGLRERLRAEGLSRVGQYSWTTAARQMVRLLEEMVHAARPAA